MGLLVLPERMVDEGPLGFRFRLAAANLLSIRDLTQLEICGKIQPVHGGMSIGIDGVEDHSVPWVRRWSRYCPTCLGSGKYWSIGWEILFAEACTQCGRWLVDTCNHCFVQVSWTRDQLLRCACGKYLADDSASSAPDSVVRLSQALQNVAMGRTPISIPIFQGLNLGQCVRLIRLLGTYGTRHGQVLPQKVPNLDRLDVSWSITCMAAEVVDTWPAGFAKLLEELRSHGGDDGTRKLSTAFRGFYSALYKGFKDKEFDFVRAAFENYVMEHWTGAIGKRNRRLKESVLQTLTWIPANHACRLLRVSRRRLDTLIQEGRIQGEKRWSTARRVFIVVKRSDVEKLVTTMDDGIPLIDAASRLGFTKQRFHALLPYICPQAKKLGTQGCRWAIPTSWIDRWEALIQFQNLAEPLGTETVSLKHLIRYWQWTNEQIGLLLVDILKGVVVPAGLQASGKSLGDLVLYVDQLNQWFSGKQKTPCIELTVPDTALRIGIKQEVVYALIRSGLLQATSRKVGLRHEQRIKLSTLELFDRRYILGRDVARSLERSPRSVLKFLIAAGVRPITGPGVDNCRQIVFLKHEVNECLRLNGLEVVA